MKLIDFQLKHSGSTKPIEHSSERLKNLPEPGKTVWSDLYHFLLRRPATRTLIRFTSRQERKNFSQRILQCLGIGVDK